MLFDTTLGPRVEFDTSLTPEECAARLRARVRWPAQLHIWVPPAAGADFVAGSVGVAGGMLHRLRYRASHWTPQSRPYATVTFRAEPAGTHIGLSVGVPVYLLLPLLGLAAAGVCVGLPLWLTSLLLVLDDPSRAGPWLLLASLTVAFGGVAVALGLAAARVPEDTAYLRAFLERTLDAHAAAPGDPA